MKLTHLSWDDLRVFLTLSRAGNLSKAGRLLGMDHATVGRRVSALEYALETPLFERDRQGYRLNSHGKEMLAYVEAVEANILTLGDLLNGEQPGLSGHVRIATMEGIASLYLTEQFAELKRHHPGITIELITSATDVRIAHREADIFLGFFEPAGSNLEVQKIGQFILNLYASPAYLAEHGTPENADELDQHRFIGYVDDLIQLDAVRWLDDAVKNPTIVFRSTSMISQMFAAAAGAGIVMLPQFARAERFGLTQILTDQIKVPRGVWMTTHHYLRKVPRIRAVASFLEETLARDYPVA